MILHLHALIQFIINVYVVHGFLSYLIYIEDSFSFTLPRHCFTKPSVAVQAACDDVMEPGMIVHIPVSVAEAKISKRFDTIPTATLYPNADEIEYLQRLVMHKACVSYLLRPYSDYPVLSIHCASGSLSNYLVI